MNTLSVMEIGKACSKFFGGVRLLFFFFLLHLLPPLNSQSTSSVIQFIMDKLLDQIPYFITYTIRTTSTINAL